MVPGEQQVWSGDREQQEVQQGVRQVWRRCAVLVQGLSLAIKRIRHWYADPAGAASHGQGELTWSCVMLTGCATSAAALLARALPDQDEDAHVLH
jgi:hypothetical protein